MMSSCFTLSTGQGGFQKGSQAFLFSMYNSRRLGPTKLPLIKPECAIYCHKSYGPTFGRRDLYISGDSNRNCYSCSALGRSYECPPGQADTFLVTEETFKVLDYEVFGLQY